MVNKRVQNAILGCNLKNDRMISVRFQGKPFKSMPQSVTLKKLKLNVSMKTYKTFQNTQKRCLFHYRELECKSTKSRNTWSNRQIWNTEWSRTKANSFAKRMHWSQQTPSSNNTREHSTHGHHQMVNTKIRLIIFFAAKDGEALYSQQKQEQELTVAQIMNSLLPNSDFSWRK